MVIETERLVLKSISENDQKAMIDILVNNQVKETYMIPGFKDEQEAIKLFNRFKELSLSPNRYVFGIYKDDYLIGFLNDVEIKDDFVEMGYVIHPAYHNQGYATEAFKAVIAHLFEVGFKEVVAGAFESNEASIRVMIKCGMNKQDNYDEIEYRGKIHHCVYYSIKIM